MTKKYVIVIVEGQSDKTALSLLFNRTFREAGIKFAFIPTDGDLTSDLKSNPSNVVKKIHQIANGFMSTKKLKPADILMIVQLTDADGAFIPDEAVRYSAGYEKPYYSVHGIETDNPEGIRNRNERKRSNILRLYQIGHINIQKHPVPFRMYYMSANLDHVLYQEPNLDPELKVEKADEFKERYADHLEEFRIFLYSFIKTVSENYPDSWSYLQQGLHSLERETNLGLLMKELEHFIIRSD